MPTRKAFFAAALVAAASFNPLPVRADDAPPAPATTAPGEALSPAVQTAIANLGADDYKVRQNAVKNLEIALGQQMRALVSSDDPEIQSRIISLLQFNDGLSRWMIDVYKLPAAQRKATIEFGLKPDVLPLLAKVFSPEADKRVEAAHDLAKIDQPEATVLLAKLLVDDDRAVYLAAMEAVWDRKPTDGVVEALWDRSVEAGMRASRGGYVAPRSEQNLKFRGQPLPPINFYDSTPQRQMQDSNIATDVLIHIQAPQVVAKLKAFLEGYEKAIHGEARNMWLYSGNSLPMRNVIRIIGAYKSKDTLKILYNIATSPAVQQSQTNINGQNYCWSNRTTALATLIETLGLKPADYKLKQQAMLSNMWTTPTAEDENKAVNKVKEYWASHAKELGQDPAAKSPADETGNAGQPADNAAPAIIAPRPLMRPLQMRTAPMQVAPALPPASAPAPQPR